MKLIMECTNCGGSEIIVTKDTKQAVLEYLEGEGKLCIECSKLWAGEVAAFRAECDRKFRKLQIRFGLVEDSKEAQNS